ncbi:MAG: hypothetical protein ABH881_01955 [bacterium]
MNVRCICGRNNRFKGKESEISRGKAKIKCSSCGVELAGEKKFNGRCIWQPKRGGQIKDDSFLAI